MMTEGIETEFEYLGKLDKEKYHENFLIQFEIAHQLKRIADHLEWFTQFAEDIDRNAQSGAYTKAE